MKTDKKIIGRIIEVSFPQLKLNNVLAKIDTGAYRGTLHCTDVELIKKGNKETLSFVPLDLRHPNFSRDPVTVENFSRALVKLTNGYLERRFVISTPIAIDQQTYEVEISLSDRTDMRSPVLIGRKFLRGKFIVDVQS